MNLKGVRLETTLETFLNEHKEIIIKKSPSGKIEFLVFLEDVQITFLYISSGQLLTLEYIYNGNIVHYECK